MSTVPNATAAPAANKVDAAQAAPVEQKQPVVAADAGQSTLATAQPTESRGFFGTIYDGVASVFTWIKDKFVAIYNFIFGSCSSACEADATPETELQKLQAKQARFEQYHKDFKAEGWKDVFNAMPKEDQDLIIKQDMRAVAVHKKVEDADIDGYVESRFKVQDKIDYSLELVRDLKDDKDYIAAVEVPNYLEEIAAAIAEKVDTLKAQEEKK